jgi:hypothetical protein
MMKTQRVGEVELTEPDQRMVNLTKEILAQNKMVLEMNAQLLATISRPAYIISVPETGVV